MSMGVKPPEAGAEDDLRALDRHRPEKLGFALDRARGDVAEGVRVIGITASSPYISM